MKSKELLEAYKNTIYRVYLEENSFIDLFIDKFNLDVINILDEYKATNGIFITAYNPYSKLLTKEENELRQNKLIEEIKLLDLKYFYGEGIGLNTSWEPEKSIFVLNVKEEIIDYLLDKYQQNAVVFIDKLGKPVLYWNIN